MGRKTPSTADTRTDQSFSPEGEKASFDMAKLPCIHPRGEEMSQVGLRRNVDRKGPFSQFSFLWVTVPSRIATSFQRQNCLEYRRHSIPSTICYGLNLRDSTESRISITCVSQSRLSIWSLLNILTRLRTCFFLIVFHVLPANSTYS